MNCNIQKITVSKDKVEKYNALMQADHVDYEKNKIPRYSTIESWTADFGGDIQMDVKVCSSTDGDPLWCEGVLFRHGSECGCTDVYDILDGTFQLDYEGDSYCVEIVKSA